jgi:5-amino-6-(5-phosphoribosylamino)uracil reductase/diaminohydroxyphosphoribosylaminopyrimidine deaminase/5-amino-6-(5-phosphoribosylamino)uracil reductase
MHPLEAARPWTTIHVAQSLDGKIALPGARAVLSSREGWQAAHRARAEHDAVLVGSDTVRADDPRLTVRECTGRDPLRIVLSSRLDISLNARLFSSSSAAVLLIGVEGRALPDACARMREKGAEVRLVRARDDGLVSLTEALSVIRGFGVERLLIEGGAKVLTSFLRERLVDEAAVEIVPRIFGGKGLSVLGDIGVTHGENALRLCDVHFDRAGQSVIVRGRFDRS